MRYVVRMSVAEAIRALARRGVPVDGSQVRPAPPAPGWRYCCDSPQGGGHMSDCIAPPHSALRKELDRQEKQRPAR